MAPAGARRMIGALILRDVRRGFTGAAWLPIAFFLLVATLVPFAIGTPGLAALAVAVAALTAGLPRAGSMAGLLLLPVAVPLLIFAAAFCGDGGNQAMALEAAVSILLLAGAPFVAGAAIRA